MNKAVSMQIAECVQQRIEQLASLYGREWALGNDLRQNFISKVRDDVDKSGVPNLRATEVMDSKKVRVRKGRSGFPDGQAFFCSRRCGDQFDGGLRCRTCRFGAKDATSSGSAAPFEERKSPVNDLADPIAANRNCIHGSPSLADSPGSRRRFHGEEPRAIR